MSTMLADMQAFWNYLKKNLAGANLKIGVKNVA
jgi:hypothetical protein